MLSQSKADIQSEDKVDAFEQLESFGKDTEDTKTVNPLGPEITSEASGAKGIAVEKTAAAAPDANFTRQSHHRAIQRGPGGVFSIPRASDEALLRSGEGPPASQQEALRHGSGGKFHIEGRRSYAAAAGSAATGQPAAASTSSAPRIPAEIETSETEGESSEAGGETSEAGGETAPVTPPASERKTLVMIEGKSNLPLRVVTRPFSHIYTNPDEEGGIEKENIEPFSVFYVMTLPSGGGETGEAGGWYEISTSIRATSLGWMRADDVIEWKQTLCVEYVHPDEAHPVLMFRNQAALRDVAKLDLEERQQKAESLYKQIDAGNIPPGFPVISMSPKRAIDFQNKFYLMPILEHDIVHYGAWEGRLLKVAAAAKAEAGRGATLITDEETRGQLSIAATGREADLAKLKFDVVFVMDLTRSMQPFVDGALAFVNSAAKTLGADPSVQDRVKFGFWGYRDSEEIDGIGFNTRNYTEDLQPLADFSRTLAQVEATKTDSVDFDEDVYAGVHDAVTRTRWTDGAVRMIVLVGDAPAHPLGHKWNSTMMSADDLRALADTSDVSILSYHIKDPKFPKYHDTGKRQFAKLAENPGTISESSTAYYSTNTRDMEQFRSDADIVISQIVKPILHQVDLKAPVASVATADGSSGSNSGSAAAQNDQEAIAAEFVRAAVVQWLGKAQGIEAPKDITAWVTDKDLVDPSAQALKINMLLTKNQLDSLVTGLKATLEAGVRGSLSGARFFDELQATSAAAAVKPDQIRNAKRLADTGLIPQFLDGLPYTSEVMDLNDEIWDSWGETRQDDFLKTVEAKVAYYESLHDSPDAWVELAKGVDEDDKVTPIPLARLP